MCHVRSMTIDRRARRGVTLLLAVLAITQLPACRSASHGAGQSSTTIATGATTPSSNGSGASRGLAASRLVFWTDCEDVVALSDAQIDEWHDRGVGGFVCVIQHLADLGGDQRFTADPRATPSGTEYSLERQMRDSKIVNRAKARGIKMWLGFYLSNSNSPTPLDEWFDDAAWSTEVLPQLADVAGAAKALGFAGLGFDEEMYDNGSWDWNYPGNNHSEGDVRAQVRARGAQVMRTLVTAFPGIDIIDYGTYLPDGWNALVQQEINHAQSPYTTTLQINLWDGLTSVPGYGAIRFFDATFYKTAHLSGASWDNALAYNVNRLMAYFSRNLSNWAYAAGRVNVSPFAWIDGDVKNEGAFTAPRPPSYVADQLAAFRRWGMGGMFGVYTYSGLLSGRFDYGPYTNGMKAAAQPGTVDTEAPKITVNDVKRSDGTVTVSGTATDNLGVQSVVWRAGAKQGAAQMTWSVTGGNYYSRYEWETKWTATIAAPRNQSITFIVRDIKDNTASTVAKS